MSVFEHVHRARIYNPGQHPYKHTLEDFTYTHDALPGVSTLQAALDWAFTTLYPRTQDPVATPAALPAGGNTIGDYRIVTDDGDGSAAGYQWQQREGDVAAKWYKIADLDWGVPTIVSQFLLKTQDVYVYRYGYDDIDDTGALLTGVNAGQHIYGGATASKHLTLHANAGDGVGAQTGYVQLADNARPTVDSSWSLGTTAERWLKIWTDEITIATMTILGGSITDSSGAISFDNENLTTTGSITGGSFSAASGVFGTLTCTSGSITDSSGAISFGNENLSTTGTMTVNGMILATGSITDGTGAISFDNENLSTTGTLGAGVITGTQLNVDNLRLDGNTLSATNLNGGIVVVANGTGVVDVQSAMTTIGQTVTGTLSVTGQLNGDNLRMDGNTLSSTDANGNIVFTPNGTGKVSTSAKLVPGADGTLDLGATAERWNSIFLDNSLSDGTDSITIANLLTFRAVGSPSVGHSLFWDGSKWVSSAPDTEIDHGTVSGLSDDDHTQYLLLAGRAGGQTAYGGTGAGDDLTLSSTSHGTKGDVILASRLLPSADDTWDIGNATYRVADLYIYGELIGARLQNATTAGEPAASANTKGRLYFNTDENDVMLDLGGTWKKLSIEKHVYEDTTNWNGTIATYTYTVSADVSDARKCLWTFYSNSDTFMEVAGAEITKSQTQVTVTTQANLPSGTYTLIGIG